LANFKWMLVREEASGFRVLYAVTFGVTSATGLHMHASHGLTERLGEQTRKRRDIDLAKSSQSPYPNSNRRCCTRRRPFFVCITPLHSERRQLQDCLSMQCTFWLNVPAKRNEIVITFISTNRHTDSCPFDHVMLAAPFSSRGSSPLHKMLSVIINQLSTPLSRKCP